MSHAQPLGGGALEGGNRLAENELLPLQHLADGLHQLTVERGVLALEVQHGHRLGGGVRWLRIGVHFSYATSIR